MVGKSARLGEATIVSSNLHREVVELFAAIFEIKIIPESGDLKRKEIDGWDSVNHLRLVAEIEEAFHISLTDEEVTRIASLRDVEILLAERGVAV
jgi:acyl carrier protein